MNDMSDRARISITNHGRFRFVERRNKSYKHSWHCRTKGCSQCEKNKRVIEREILDNKLVIDEELKKLLRNADEVKWYINDSRIMDKLYERYGHDTHFHFLVHGDFLFVVIVKSNRRVLVTTMFAQFHSIGRIVNRPKFKKCIQGE